MGLRDAGKVQLSKSGRALEILDNHRAIEYRFYVPLAALKEVIEGKRDSAILSLLVADSREDV